jgi:hypothetical protein
VAVEILVCNFIYVVVSCNNIDSYEQRNPEVPMAWDQFWFQVQSQPSDSYLIINFDENYFYFYILFQSRYESDD